MGFDSARKEAALATATPKAAPATQAAAEASAASGLQTIPRGRGRGGGGGRGNVGRGKRSRDSGEHQGSSRGGREHSKGLEKALEPNPKAQESKEPKKSLTENIAAMRFMQSANDEQQLKMILRESHATFAVTIVKAPGSLLGITYDQKPDMKPPALAVKSISADGLVGKWNAANEKKVALQDQIIEVNGVGGSVEKILAELRKDQQLVLKLRKNPEAIVLLSKVKAVAEAKRAREQGSGDVKQPEAILVHRRSYKGANPIVELWMKEQQRKANEAVELFKDHEEAAALRGMKQRRVR